MTNRGALLLLVTATMTQGLASAQVVIDNHATGAALASPFVLPDAPVNDTEQAQIDVVNTGTAAVTISSAAVFGQYFSLCCESSFTLAPAAIETLTLSFSPQTAGYQSGSLQIDGQVILLFARADPAASLFLLTAAGSVQAHAGTPLTFTADTTAAVQIACTLQNNGTGPVTVNSITVTGNWNLGSAPAAPFVLQAGQNVSFRLSAAGTSPDGSVSGVVAIDQWRYAIVAEPTQPAVQIQVANPLKSGQQASVAIQFNPAPTAAITGTLQLTFDSSTTVSVTDPAIIFPSSGATSVDFTSVAGQTAASFGGAPSATLQTGTTAGTIHLTASWGNTSVVSNVHVSPEPIAIDTVAASRKTNALEVTLTGYDNTRTAGVMSFSFFDSKGEFVGQSISADFTEAFYNYFFQTGFNAGGMFKMTADFPVTGNAGDVSSVQIDLMNVEGDTQSSVTPF